MDAQIGHGTRREDAQRVSGTDMGHRGLDPSDAVSRRRMALITGRSDAYEVILKRMDTPEDPVYHYIEIRPDTAEDIQKHYSVNASVRVVAYRDERAVREMLENIRIPDFITDSDVAQDGSGKISTAQGYVPVIKIIDLVNAQQAHKTTPQRIAASASEQRRGIL